MSNDFGNIVYLLMLLVLVGGVLFTRGHSARNTRYLLIWAGVILGLVLAYRFYERIIFTPSVDEYGEYSLRIPYDREHGGYRINLEVNGAQISAVIDTGATSVVLTNEDAKKAGLDVDNLAYNREVSTANGITHTANSSIDQINLGEVYFENTPVMVAQPGDLEMTLIGMSLLRKFENITVQDDRMFIRF